MDKGLELKQNSTRATLWTDQLICHLTIVRYISRDTFSSTTKQEIRQPHLNESLMIHIQSIIYLNSSHKMPAFWHTLTSAQFENS